MVDSGVKFGWGFKILLTLGLEVLSFPRLHNCQKASGITLGSSDQPFFKSMQRDTIQTCWCPLQKKKRKLNSKYSSFFPLSFQAQNAAKGIKTSKHFWGWFHQHQQKTSTRTLITQQTKLWTKITDSLVPPRWKRQKQCIMAKNIREEAEWSTDTSYMQFNFGRIWWSSCCGMYPVLVPSITIVQCNWLWQMVGDIYLWGSSTESVRSLVVARLKSRFSAENLSSWGNYQIKISENDWCNCSGVYTPLSPWVLWCTSDDSRLRKHELPGIHQCIRLSLRLNDYLKSFVNP